jgi:hypothetical protein
MKLNRVLGIGVFAVAVAGFGMGCSAADGEQGGSVASAQSGGAPAKAYGGRAAAFSARVDLKADKPAALSDYDGESINLSDTKALPTKGGNQATSLATVNAGTLFKGGVANAWTHGEGSKAESSSSAANAAFFGADTTGLIDAVMGNGAVNVDVADLLKDLLPKDLMDSLFGPGGILEGGIRADLVQQDASASCDASGNASAESAAHIVRLFIKGKEYKIVDSGPNQQVFGDPSLAAVYINAQEKGGEGSSASVDSASIRVVALNGKVDAKVSRASASIECGGTDGTK